jgi:hypothetical protein
MKRIFLISGVVILLILAALFYINFTKMKAISPEKDSAYEENGLKIKVFYNSPSKRGREIFGSLVPFGKLWRTGANEPTTFESNQDLTIAGEKLPAGKYAIWTVPDEKTWKVIFNSEIPFWGIGFNGLPSRNSKKDILTVEVPVVIQDKIFEQFTISIEKVGDEMEMVFLWDRTLVAMPINK